MNTNININEFKNQFVNWYNNKAYGYSKFNTFEECHNDIYEDDYEDTINDFCNYFGYNYSNIFYLIA